MTPFHMRAWAVSSIATSMLYGADAFNIHKPLTSMESQPSNSIPWAVKKLPSQCQKRADAELVAAETSLHKSMVFLWLG